MSTAPTSPPSPPSPPSPLNLLNRCLESKSPYVHSHATNPTAWQLWDPATLALARSSNRLLFVSIGYSACHWCHVMAQESFDHPTIAKLLNDNFIPVKIDREERPDVDRVYMDFLQATTGGGGWPLNVFVTPDLQPLFGGTYWPGPGNERPGRGGSFELLLQKIAQTWREQESRCREDAGRITAQLKEFAQEGTLDHRGAGEGAEELPDIETLEDAYQHYKMRYDTNHAGFGSAPKFPTPAHLSFLLHLAQWPETVRDIVGDQESADAQVMAITTLKAMARGGIKDQVGHGFARYSVTRDWSLPHFEKMLYDNAQLLNSYLDAYLASKDPELLDTVHDIAAYLTTAPIKSPTGGFHASEDADSAPTAMSKEHKEGAFYVWTLEQFRYVINDETESEIVADYFNVKPDGNVARKHDIQGELVGQNTLCISTSTAELAAKHSISEEQAKAIILRSKAKLRKYREEHRPRPHLDDKILVSWNGLAISALARTAFALSEIAPAEAQSYLTSATEAASFIHSSLYDPSSHTLKRVYREGPGAVPGFADDYAFLISGLLELFKASLDEKWLEWAYELQETQIKLFHDHAGSGGFFSTAVDSEDVLIRSKDAMDNAEPSTNGVSARNLFRLAALLTTTTDATSSSPGSHKFQDLAVQTVRAFEVELGTHPGLMTGLLNGVVMSRLGVKSVLLTGRGARVDAALRTLKDRPWPGVVVLRVDPERAVGGWLKGKNDVLAGIDARREMVQVCSGSRCVLIRQEDELEEVLRAF